MTIVPATGYKKAKYYDSLKEEKIKSNRMEQRNAQ